MYLSQAMQNEELLEALGAASTPDKLRGYIGIMGSLPETAVEVTPRLAAAAQIAFLCQNDQRVPEAVAQGAEALELTPEILARVDERLSSLRSRRRAPATYRVNAVYYAAMGLIALAEQHPVLDMIRAGGVRLIDTPEDFRHDVDVLSLLIERMNGTQFHFRHLSAFYLLTGADSERAFHWRVLAACLENEPRVAWVFPYQGSAQLYLTRALTHNFYQGMTPDGLLDVSQTFLGEPLELDFNYAV